MDAFLSSEGLLALLTLTFLEVILGVDNVIFISILSGKLPQGQQLRARRAGLLAAMLMRIALLLSIAWIIRLTASLFTMMGRGISASILRGRQEALAARQREPPRLALQSTPHQ